EKRTRNSLPCGDKAKNLFMLLWLRQIGDQCYVRELRIFFQGDLHEKVDTLLFYPLRMLNPDRAQGHAADAVNLNSLHGQDDLRSSLIAGDQSDLGSQNVVQRVREHVGIRR